MLAKPLLSHILENDALTRGLGDPEARILVEWLVDRAEQLAAEAPAPSAWKTVQQLCLRGRAIGRFVTLWCHHRSRGAAGQLAAVERFTWPLPATAEDPCGADAGHPRVGSASLHGLTSGLGFRPAASCHRARGIPSRLHPVCTIYREDVWWVTAWGLVTAVGLIRWRRCGQTLGEVLALALVRCYARLVHRFQSNGPAPLPIKGSAILVANHTCSADPAFLTAGCSRPLSFFIAREFYAFPLLRTLFESIHAVPVTRHGKDVTAVRVGLRRLRQGRVLCIFPEGDLSNAGRGRPRPGKAGIALLALRSRAPVFPAWIEGGPQTSRLATAWLRPSRVRVVFGPEVDLSAYYERPIDRKLLNEVRELLMSRVLALRHLCRKPSLDYTGPVQGR